jgi:hypothetical protein
MQSFVQNYNKSLRVHIGSRENEQTAVFFLLNKMYIFAKNMEGRAFLLAAT